MARYRESPCAALDGETGLARNGINTFIAAKFFTTLALMLLAVSMAVFFFIGFRAIVDDFFYLYGANQWLIDPPHLGYTHWELRLPYILSIAGSAGLLGFGHWQVVVPGILCFCALAGSSYYFFSQYLPNCAAIFISIAVIVSPIFFVNSTYLSPDVMEAFFAAIAVFLFLWGVRKEETVRYWLLLSGVMIGLAMLTRYTSVGLILFFAVMFLLWPQTKRINFAFLALGFVVTFGSDFIFSYAMSGDPFYRIEVANTRNHPLKDFSIFVERDDMGKPDLSTKNKGNSPEVLGPLTISKGLQPYISLVVNHEVGLLFVFLLPSIPIVLFAGRLSKEEKRPILVFGLLGVIWFISVTYLLGLRPHPRYYVITGFGAAIWVGLAFYSLVQRRRFYLAALGFTAFLLSNLLSGSLDGKDLFEEQRLLQIIERNPEEAIHIFDGTLIKARFFLETNDLLERVSTELPPPGGLFFFTPPNQYRFDPNVRPPESWTEVEPFARRTTILGRFIDQQLLQDLFGPYVADRLSYSSPGSGLYRVPPDQPERTAEELERLGSLYFNLSN